MATPRNHLLPGSLLLLFALLAACGDDTPGNGGDAGNDAADALGDVDLTGDWYMLRYAYTADTAEVPLPADRDTTRFDQDGATFVQTLSDGFSVSGTVAGTTYTQGDGTFEAVIEIETADAATGRFEQGAFTFDFALVRQVAPTYDVAGAWRTSEGAYTVSVSGNDVTLTGPRAFSGWIAADRALLLSDPQPANGSLAAVLVFSSEGTGTLTLYTTSWVPDGAGHRTFSSSRAALTLNRDSDTPADCADLNRGTGIGGACVGCLPGFATHLSGDDTICCPEGEVSDAAGDACLTCTVDCGDNGTCAPSTDGSPACACDPGWRGVTCGAVDDCADVTCENGGVCLDIGDEGVCRCPLGVTGARCETVCASEPIPIAECASSSTIGPDACLDVIDQDLSTGIRFDCSQTGVGYCDYDGECAVGCFDAMNLVAIFDEPYAMTELWFYTDWWAKRPVTWRVFAADDFDAIRAGNEREVASGDANAAPWQCTTGDPCEDDVPDICCPDGRDQPQREVTETPTARWDVYPLEPAVGGAWVLRIEGSQDGTTINFEELAFYGNQCSLDRSCPAGMTLVDDDCVDTDGCAGAPCPTGEVCLDRLPPDAGYDCGAGGDPGDQPCDAGPCFAGVTCTNRPGETPDFACGPCPEGTTGDGVTCTPESSDGPEVISTIPAASSTTRLSTSGFNPAAPNRFELAFDRAVSSTSGTATIEHLESDFESALELRTPTSMDNTKLELWPTTPSFSSYPFGDFRVTVEGVRANDGSVLDEYAWTFTVEGCGDGVCAAYESTCSCAADCGACAGCCRYEGEDRDPSSVCRPGTTSDECGTGGASCGVCESGCAPGGVGCL
jgi:hypothetical protein